MPASIGQYPIPQYWYRSNPIYHYGYMQDNDDTAGVVLWWNIYPSSVQLIISVVTVAGFQNLVGVGGILT